MKTSDLAVLVAVSAAVAVGSYLYYRRRTGPIELPETGEGIFEEDPEGPLPDPGPTTVDLIAGHTYIVGMRFDTFGEQQEAIENGGFELIREGDGYAVVRYVAFVSESMNLPEGPIYTVIEEFATSGIAA